MLFGPLATAVGQELPHMAAITQITHKIDRIDTELGRYPLLSKIFTWGARSGILNFYGGNAGVTKLVVQLVSEENGEVIEAYFEDGSLLYAVVVSKIFGPSVPADARMRGTPDQTVPAADGSISEERYYLQDGDLVGWLSGRGRGPVTLVPVTADEEKLAAKGEQISRMAGLWRAFGESAETDFLKFRRDSH